MARCVCCSRPPSCRRSPPSADSPRPRPGWRRSFDVKASTSSSSSRTTATWSCRARRPSSSTFPRGPARRGFASAITRSPVDCTSSTSRAWHAAIPYLRPDGDGWPDNAERFFRFARAIAARVQQSPPDVLHLNDWHTGAALAALTDQPPTVLSIHNLAYQGVAPGRVAAGGSVRGPSTTNGGAAPTRSPARSRWPMRSWRCRRRTRRRS